MSTSAQRPIRAKEPADKWQPRPALREAMQTIATIAADDPTALIGDTEISLTGSE